MDLLESKREINNTLIRDYLSNNLDNISKEKVKSKLINFNLDLINYLFNNEFLFNVTEDIYLVAINGLIYAIENYEMDKISGFEEFIIENIRNEVNKYIVFNNRYGAMILNMSNEKSVLIKKLLKNNSNLTQ